MPEVPIRTCPSWTLVSLLLTPTLLLLEIKTCVVVWSQNHCPIFSVPRSGGNRVLSLSLQTLLLESLTGKSMDLDSQTRVQVIALLLTRYGIWGKSTNYSDHQFPHLQILMIVIITSREDPCKLHAKCASSAEPSDWDPDSLFQRNENLHSHKNLDTNVCSTVICNSEKVEAIEMSFNGWKVKLWSIWYTTEYLVTEKQLLIHVTTWMNIQRIMLSGKEKLIQRLYSVFQFLQHSWSKIIEGRLVVVWVSDR